LSANGCWLAPIFEIAGAGIPRNISGKEPAMDNSKEDLAAMNKAVIDAANRFAAIALQGAEDMMKVQMNAVKNALSDGMQQAKALSQARDLQSLQPLQEKLAQPVLEKTTDYLKSVYDVAAATQAEISQLLEEQVADLNKRTAATLDRSSAAAPAGSEAAIAAFKSALSAVNTVYDNMLKMSKQMSAMTNANINAVTAQATRASAKKKAD
jgi:phasin family protein